MNYNTAPFPEKAGIVSRAIMLFVAISTIIPFYLSYQSSSAMYNLKYVSLTFFVIVLLGLSKSGFTERKMMKLGFMAFLFSVCFLNLINIDPYIMSYSRVVSYTTINCMIGVMAVFLFPNVRSNHFRTILFIFLVAIFVTVTIPSLIHIKDPSTYYLFAGRTRFFAIFSNANELARFALLGFLLSLKLWTLYQKRIQKLFFIFMIGTSGYIIYLTNSRASMLVAVLAVVSVVAIYLYKHMPRLLFASTVWIIAGPLIVFTAFYVWQMVNTLNLEEVSSGRIGIWEEILNTSWRGRLFGTGPMQDVGGHNGFLEIIKYYGYLGFGVWMILIFGLLRTKVKFVMKNPSMSNLLGVSIILLMMIYYCLEGGLVSVGNIASVYFWLELSQRDKE